MSTQLKAKLAEIRARAEAATPGPWKPCYHWRVDHCPCGNHRGFIWAPDGERVIAQMGCAAEPESGEAYPNMGQDGMRADARFVAASRTDVPFLVSRLERAVEQHAFAEAATKDLQWQLDEVLRQRDGDIKFAVDAARKDEIASIRGWIECYGGPSLVKVFDEDEARLTVKRGTT